MLQTKLHWFFSRMYPTSMVIQILIVTNTYTKKENLLKEEKKQW